MLAGGCIFSSGTVSTGAFAAFFDPHVRPVLTGALDAKYMSDHVRWMLTVLFSMQAEILSRDRSPQLGV